MISAGIDLGGEWAKVVLLAYGQVLSYSVLPYGTEPVATTAQRGLRDAMEKGNISQSDIEYAVAVGSYRGAAPFAQEVAAEPLCCVRGATSLLPTTRTVIDFGAEKCLVVRCERGVPLRSVRSGRCAAGSGRFLRMVSNVLGVEVEQTEGLYLKSTRDMDVEATCAVFAESEVISLLHQGHAPEDIIRGTFREIARHIYPLLASVGPEQDVAMVGGLARNKGIVKAIENEIGHKLRVPEDPVMCGALGASIIAAERQMASQEARR